MPASREASHDVLFSIEYKISTILIILDQAY